jgi:hypothetical protein
MTARESVQDKAKRYLVEGRVTVTAVNGDLVSATCAGSGDVYDLGYHPARGWWCSCPVRTGRSHLTALWLITIRKPVRPDIPAPVTPSRPAA